MNDFITSAILGVVEGVTEFLPISSTGHLILVNQWIGFKEPFGKMFDIVIQLGAILAVVVVFWKRLWPFGNDKSAETKSKMWNLWLKILIAIVPALVLGFLFKDFIEAKLFTPMVVACALAVWGLVIIIIEKLHKAGSDKIASVDKIGYGYAFFIGLIQCLAMVPGTSRSAATIMGAMLLGCSRIAAAEFSFFLAIPTMVAASGYSLLKSGTSMNAHDILVLALGFAVAFAVALAVIKFFMKFISNHKFTGFGIYRIVLGAAITAYFLFLS